MPTRHIITIIKGRPNGRLQLSDNDHTKAGHNDTVVWVIAPQSNVASIEIEKKSGSIEIFAIPPRPIGNIWQGVISPTAPPSPPEYQYSILWKDTSGNSHVYDPKISVKPAPIAPNAALIEKIVLVLVGVFLAVFSIKFLSRNKSIRGPFKDLPAKVPGSAQTKIRKKVYATKRET
jgi:hypothetical protein